jgi:Phage integrase, N-terminal SAM-like domain
MRALVARDLPLFERAADCPRRASGRKTPLALRRVARRRYQSGCLFKGGKRRKVWVARWREDVLLESGQLGRLHKSVVLGLVADLPTRRDALTKLEEHIRPVNQGTTRPEAMMSFGVFAETQWSALVLPTLKLSTQHGYKSVLNKHVLPYWRSWRLRDIGKLDVQQFVADRFRQQLGWQTVRNSWTLLSGILETAVEYGYLTVNPARGVTEDAEVQADDSAWASRDRVAESTSRSIDAQERRRSGVPEQVRRTSPRIEAAGARATTGGGTCGARARDVASVPPHSLVAAQRSARAGEDRARATRAREHPDDAQHLHARRRCVASRGDRIARTAVVPNCSQVAESGHSVRLAKCHETCWLELEAPPGFEPGVEVLQTSALPLGDGAPFGLTR